MGKVASLYLCGLGCKWASWKGHSREEACLTPGSSTVQEGWVPALLENMCGEECRDAGTGLTLLLFPVDWIASGSIMLII